MFHRFTHKPSLLLKELPSFLYVFPCMTYFSIHGHYFCKYLNFNAFDKITLGNIPCIPLIFNEPNNLEIKYSRKSQKGETHDRYTQHLITIHGGGTGFRGTVIPPAPGVWFPHQPPSQRSLRHQNKEIIASIQMK